MPVNKQKGTGQDMTDTEYACRSRWRDIQDCLATDPERYRDHIVEKYLELQSYLEAGLMPDDIREEFLRFVREEFLRFYWVDTVD